MSVMNDLLKIPCVVAGFCGIYELFKNSYIREIEPRKIIIQEVPKILRETVTLDLIKRNPLNISRLPIEYQSSDVIKTFRDEIKKRKKIFLFR